MNMFGNPAVIMPKYVQTPSRHTSFMSTPCLFFKPMLHRLNKRSIYDFREGMTYHSRASKAVETGGKHNHIEFM
jgi:hypothetical protein